MEWDERTRERLEIALNESDVVGVRLAQSAGAVDILLDVFALPADGPLYKDGRRILRLTSPSELQFVLRLDGADARSADARAFPLADLDVVEGFFDSLAWGGSIYGWRFFDEPSLTADWPRVVSLVVGLRESAGAHTFYWFNECGVPCGAGTAAYCIEGTVTFDDLLVLDAQGTEIPTDTFIADGVRMWEAFNSGDERMSIGAQRAANDGALRWRRW